MANDIIVQIDMRRLQEIERRAGSIAADIAQALAFYVEGKAKAAMGTGAAGRTYTRKSAGGQARVHTASAPGSPPAIDTGALRASIHTERVNNSTFLVSDGVKYGAALEFGYPRRNLAARPFMRPAIEDMQRNIVPLVRSITDEVLK